MVLSSSFGFVVFAHYHPLYMQLSPLLSDSVSHCWPSAQIYLLIPNRVLVSDDRGVQCGEVAYAKEVRQGNG